MPVYKIRGPDGKIYRYKVNAENPDKEDVLSSFKQQYAIRSALKAFEAPKEEAGFFGSFKEAVTSLGLTDEAAAFAANPTAENREAFLKAAESKYKSVGGFGKGENWEAFKELLGSSLGSLVAPIGAAVVGGGLPGFAAASGAQYSIANLQRQAEAQQAAAEAGEPIPEVSLGRAAAAAAAQTGLDVVPGALILKGLRSFPLAQRLLAEDKISNKAAQVLIDAFKNKNLSLKGNIAKGVGLGVAFEVPQEIAQQALERWQAGLSLTDDEAKEEFKQAAIGAAVLGGGFGAIGGVGTYRGVQADKAAEAARRAQEQQDIESSLLGAGPIEGGIPAQLYEEDEARKQAELEESMFGAGPIEGGIPADMLESEAEREARLEREAIQAYEREQEARLPRLERGQYSARTLREAAEAEALAPREDEEPLLYTPPKQVAEEEEVKTVAPPAPSTEGVMEGLGAPTEGGIPAEMFETPPRETALDRISERIISSNAGSDFVKDLYSPNPVDAVLTNFEDLDTVTPEEINQSKEYIKSISQNLLRNEFGDEVTLYRGLKGTEERSPVLSYTLNEDVAKFQATQQGIRTGKIEEIRVPISEVLSYSEAIGRGTFAEDEVIIPASARTKYSPKPTSSPREIALEVIKTTPTIKAVAEATGLNQPKAAALVRQFVDEGILERKGNKFVLAAPPSAAEPEATDVPSAATVDTETDGRSDRRSPELFTLESPTGELGAVPTRPAGLDTTGDVTERVDDREGTVPPALETEGVLEGLGAPIEGGIPAEYFAERERIKDLRTRAINFIRETGRGNAPDLQKALDISLGEAKALRKSLLGSGAVVQKTNVKAAKTAGRSYFVVEGDYRPSDKFVPRGAAVSEAREEPVAETGFEELGLEGTSAETGLPPEMLDTYLRLEEARQKAAGRLRGEGVESKTERAQREADKAAELTADIKRKLPPTLSPDIGQGEYGLQYYDAEKGLTFRAYPTVGERNEARAKLANERNDKGQLKGNKDFKTFSRMAEVAKFELDYIKRQALPAMSKAQLERAVRGIRAGMSKIKSQLGLFTEEEAPTPQKAAPARVTPRELIDYANRVVILARDSGKLKKYTERIQRVFEAVQRRDADLRAEYKKLAGIETSLTKAEAKLGEATQADLEEISDIDVEETEDGEVRVKERDDTYEPLDFRKTKYQRFKKKKSQVKGMRLDAVRDLVNRITNGWKNPPNFIIVQSYLDLPAEFDPETHADSMGLAYGNDVYLIADNIRHLSDLKAVVFHESLGHYGLEQLFGERLFQVMLDIYRTNSRIRADADAWLEENPDAYPESEYTQDERRALAAEEIFAEISEAGPSADPKVRAAFNRVAALVRKFIRALGKMVGKELAYNNREIADIVAQAHNKVITGNTRLIPRYNNIRYMKSTYNKVLTDALRYVQNNAPAATQTILTNNINALDNLPEPMRDFKLSTFSLHHMMQLYERYAPSIRRLNLLVERMAKDATDMLVDHQKKTFDYRKTLRDNPNFIDAFNDVANFINISQAPVLEEQLNANGEFVRFVPNVAAQQLRNIPMGSAAYNALTPEEKVLHQAVNQFYALPVDMQRAVADIYTDYRKYSDQAFKVKLEQFLNLLPPATVAAIKKKYQDNRLKFYLPLRREGTYKLSYLNSNGTRVSEFYVSEAERNLGREKAVAGGATSIKEEMVGDRSYESARAPTGLLKELSDNVEEALKRVNASQATIDETRQIIFDTFVDYMPGTSGNDLRQEINSRVTWVMNGYTFTGRLGAIEDVIGVYEKAVPRMIYQINNLKYTMPLEKVREKISNQLAKYNADKDTDPRFAGLPNLDPDYVKNIKADLDKRIKFAKNPIYSNYVYALSKANYIYSIALNISSALINTTILPMMAWPSLAAKYGMADATKAVGQAMAMFFRNSYRNPTTGRLQFNVNPTFGNGATGEFAQLHRMLEARSVTGTSAEQELQQAQNITVPGYEGLSAKANLLMSYVFRSSERFNREVTAIAAYMLARNIDANGQRLNPNRGQASVHKATEEAIRLNYDVNGSTLPETNSRLYQNDIGRIVLTFRTHALNMILNLAFTFNQAIEKINANQPNAAERELLKKIAKRKLLYIFGSTYMLTGIKGLPLFGAAEVLASLIMGDDDEPYDLEQEVLDSVGTLGLNGPVNELLNIDIASRTGFYGLLWRDDPKRLAEVGIPVYVMERIAGPTYGLVEAARRGFNDLADGELVRASEALTPAPIRNMIKGMRYGIEGAQTRDGLPIVDDVSAYNSVMQILGFAPADLAVAQAQRGATYQVSEKLKNRRVALLTNLYAARKAGNAEGMEKALDDIRSFNESNPSYRITGDTISKSYSERERRAREAIMGVYQPRNLRIATSEYVADLDEEDGLF